MDPWSEWNRDRDDEHDGFQPGDEIGPYEILFPSASGGMATVWAGRRRGARGADHIVAVKLLSDALQNEDDARAMFVDEARTASRILHPNVVEIFACGEVRRRPYIAMEWIDGDSLSKIAAVQRTKGALLPLPWVLHVVSAVCAGLHAAHEVRDDAGELLHLIHRDVTPANVMVGFDGTVKVVDFGVAKSRAQTQVSRAGVIKGKTAYFSPEQVTGETIDRRSDLFSLGCLMYLMVTGHPPFRGRGMLEVVNQIANRTPQRPLEIMPELHPDLDRIIMRALEKDPAARYQTAAEVRRDIEKVRATLGGSYRKRDDVGTLVSGLFPGVTETRTEKIVAAAAKLDQATERTPLPAEEPRPARPEDATEVMMRRVALLFSGPPESTSGRKSEPASVRRPDQASSRNSDPASARHADPDTSRPSDPDGERRSDPGPMPAVGRPTPPRGMPAAARPPAPAAARSPAPRAKKKRPDVSPAALSPPRSWLSRLVQSLLRQAVWIALAAVVVLVVAVLITLARAE